MAGSIDDSDMHDLVSADGCSLITNTLPMLLACFCLLQIAYAPAPSSSSRLSESQAKEGAAAAEVLVPRSGSVMQQQQIHIPPHAQCVQQLRIVMTGKCVELHMHRQVGGCAATDRVSVSVVPLFHLPRIYLWDYSMQQCGLKPACPR